MQHRKTPLAEISEAAGPASGPVAEQEAPEAEVFYTFTWGGQRRRRAPG